MTRASRLAHRVGRVEARAAGRPPGQRYSYDPALLSYDLTEYARPDGRPDLQALTDEQFSELVVACGLPAPDLQPTAKAPAPAPRVWVPYSKRAAKPKQPPVVADVPTPQQDFPPQEVAAVVPQPGTAPVTQENPRGGRAGAVQAPPPAGPVPYSQLTGREWLSARSRAVVATDLKDKEF